MGMTWETALRLITIGADSLLIALLLAGAVRRPLRIALAGMLIGSICYLLTSSPALGIERNLRALLDIFSIFTPFWTWLVARLLFERGPSAGLLAGLAGLLAASWFAAHYLEWAALAGFLVIHLTGLALLADLGFTAWSGRDDDLVERRRVIRLWLPLLVAVQAGGILILELAFGTQRFWPDIQLFNVLSILALTVFVGTVLLRTDPELLVETESANSRSSHSSAEPLSPAEIVLKDKLEAAMREGFYRCSGLTIAVLSTHLGVPEHRLRALINQRLGYRNFAAFLNRHRIEEAKAVLSNREQVMLPVITIAMDLGYNSLPSFNRAFREMTDRTPTQYRRQAIGQN